MECTSAAIQGLTEFTRSHPVHRREEVESCIEKGAKFIENIQEADGSWSVFPPFGFGPGIMHTLISSSLIGRSTFCCRYGSWGVCYTYGTWFGVKGLVAAGRSSNGSSTIRKARDFLLSKQLPCGGWGESYLSCQNKVLRFSKLAHL